MQENHFSIRKISEIGLIGAEIIKHLLLRYRIKVYDATGTGPRPPTGAHEQFRDLTDVPGAVNRIILIDWH